MARTRTNALPKYLELNPRNRTYYYRNPSMSAKANLGKDLDRAVRLACSLNSRHRAHEQQESARIEACLDLRGERFNTTFASFIEKYICDYRLKPSTARRVHQRQKRLQSSLATSKSQSSTRNCFERRLRRAASSSRPK